MYTTSRLRGGARCKSIHMPVLRCNLHEPVRKSVTQCATPPEKSGGFWVVLLNREGLWYIRNCQNFLFDLKIIFSLSLWPNSTDGGWFVHGLIWIDLEVTAWNHSLMKWIMFLFHQKHLIRGNRPDKSSLFNRINPISGMEAESHSTNPDSFDEIVDQNWQNRSKDFILHLESPSV